MSLKPFHETTSADNKSIGFDYQFYYFLNLLLKLSQGEAIGYEIKDDIHIEMSNGREILLQAKHSVEAGNLTERDEALWKTISNWVEVINDKVSGRELIENQLIFIKNTDFILVSNKKTSSRNGFLIKLSEFQDGTIDLLQFENYLVELHKKTKDSPDSPNPIKGYISKLMTQPSAWLGIFLKKLEFRLDQDDLVKEIKNKIEEKMISPNRVDDVFNSLFSNLKQDMYSDIKGDKKILITFDDFKRKYRKCFEVNRAAANLPIRRLPISLPQNLHDQVFIKQLLDIGDITVDDHERITEYTGYKLKVFNNLSKWLQDGDITTDELKAFEDRAKLRWQNYFVSAHRKSRTLIKQVQSEEAKNELLDKAIKCLDDTRTIELEFQGTPLEVDMSNGQYYLLSDRPEIGWEFDWEVKHKK